MKPPLNSTKTPLSRPPEPEGAGSHATLPGDPGGHPSDLQIPRQSLAKTLISFPVLLGGLLVAGLFVTLREFTVDGDLWWHIKVGQTILATHQWPTTDGYSFTAHGMPWMAYEWVGEVLLAAVQRAWGLQGLLALNLAVGAAVVLGLYALATLRSRNSKAAFVGCCVVLYFIAVFCTLRPQMLAYVFLILTLIILERFRQGRSGTLWLLPLLFLLWVNTHGTFVVGLFAVGVYIVSGLFEMRSNGLESRRWTAAQRLQLESAFLASLVALTVTPYGSKLAGFPVDMALFHPLIGASIVEWQSMPFNSPPGKLFLGLLVGFLLAQVVLRPTWQLAEFTLFLCGLVAACLHARLVLIFVPFCTPLLAVILSRWIPPYEPGKDKLALNAVLIIAIVVSIARFFPSQTQLESRVQEHWPLKAVQYLEQHPPPLPMFNTYSYGGYLIYALDGRNKVFIDGRTDIYDQVGVLTDYGRIGRVEPIALRLLDVYSVQSCLIERNEALGTLLAASPRWQKVYADGQSALFVRSQVRE
jgi:hypothetical protein